MKLLLWINKHKKSEIGEATIMLRITYKGDRINHATSVNVFQEKWDRTRQRIRGSSEHTNQLNTLLQTYLNKALAAFNELLKEDKDFTARDILSRYKGEDRIQMGMLEAYDFYLKQMTNRVGVDLTASTVKKYRTTRGNLASFIEEELKCNDIPVRKVDKTVIAIMEQYFRGKKHFRNNYVNKTMEHIRKAYKNCILYNWADNNPFEFLSFKKTETTKDFLTMEELIKLINHTPTCERMGTTKDIFIFMCFTGLAHTDACKVSADNIKKGVDNQPWLQLRRTKTDNLVQVPLLPIAVQLIRKYAHHKKCTSKGVLMPIPTNQVFNRALKLLTEEIGFRKKITSHSGRYTFASTVLLANGIRMEVAQKLLAHNSIKSTAIYAKLNEHTLAKEVSELHKYLPLLAMDEHVHAE